MEFVLTHPDTGLKQILVIFDGVPYEADSDHRWWNEIVQLCIADDPRVLDLFPPCLVQEPSVEVPFEPEEEETPRWLPHDVEPDEREQERRAKAAEEAGEGGQDEPLDEEEEARAGSREAEFTAHEIIEEGS